MSNMPLVSCLCCSYGRNILLGEAIKCFVDQDYPNKELIVLNDQENVSLRLDHFSDNIKIINRPKRFNSLGQKRNHLKSLARGELICIWDDDDLYCPWRISESVKLMENNVNCDILKTSSAFMSVDNHDYKIANNLFHSQALIRKSYMDKNYYPDKSVGEDIDFEKLARVESINCLPYYVYRWGCGVHHLSGIGDDKRSWERALTFESYKRMKGEIVIYPEFKNDYWKNIGDFLKKSHHSWSIQWEEKFKKLS